MLGHFYLEYAYSRARERLRTLGNFMLRESTAMKPTLSLILMGTLGCSIIYWQSRGPNNPREPNLLAGHRVLRVYAQVVDDLSGKTLVSASTLEKDLRQAARGNIADAKSIGEIVAKRSLEKGIKKVVFDRAGYLYHGRIEALASAARAAGLDF